MSEHTQNNQTLVIGLVAVAALLAALVGVIVWQQSKALPPATPAASSAQGAAPAAGGGSMMGGTTGAAAVTTEVDPATATKVSKGTEPEAFVRAYYEACDKGEWEAAFKMLPAAKQKGNSAAALQQQVEGYGIKSWEITSATTEGDTATVFVDQVTGSYGTFENQWTFTQKDGAWFVASKAVTGMK